MLMKLTFYDKGTSTLVNTELIETIYRLYDKTKDKYSTKIKFFSGEFINVEEDLPEIMKIQENFELGEFQDRKCSVPDMLEQKFEREYNREFPKHQKVREY